MFENTLRSRVCRDPKFSQTSHTTGLIPSQLPSQSSWTCLSSNSSARLPCSNFSRRCCGLWTNTGNIAFFSIFNVFMFESTTVFQRLKTMKTLDGMSSKSVPILVFRNRQWETTTTADLVPGDLISVCRTTTAGPPVAGRQPVAVNDSVPCDCLILRGSAVVNEATLTGESVPQMKDAASADYSADKKPLDIDGVDRVHVLFSGTSLINSTPTKQANSNSGGGGANRSAATHTEVDDIPAPPNNGCLCYVLRTGFNSSQGELVQMIEFSTQRVSSNNRETFMALGILLLFALVAAGYVLKKGLEKGDQTTHQLLLKCVIIVTSVVPQQLPMQMALAVNTALMQLMKSGIFCTEPFRVPYAGKIQHCLFDKTGTLSTDKLIPIGVVNTSASGKRGTVSRKDGSGAADAVVKDLGDGQFLVRVPHAAPAAAMVLAACHSLVQVNDTPPAIQATSGAKKAITDGPKQAELIGDPVELAALQGISWEYNAKRQEARPGGLKIVRAKLGECLKAIADHERTAPAATASADIRFAFNSKAKDLENQKNGLEALMAQTERRDANCPISAVRIQSRHHFASSLQRMSVVCNVTANARVAARRHRGKGDDANVAGSTAGEPEHFEGQFVLVKGSPEAIGRLLVDGGRPEWYESVYRSLAEDGMRVLALAYKSCQGVDGTQKSREWCESGLTFAGFISFACKTRTDSRMVVQALQESDHKVAMITGDAALTALHVARETGIVRQRDPTDASKPMPVLLLEPTFDGEGGAKEDAAHALARVATGARWVGVTGSLDQREGAARKFVAGEEMRKLSETNDLVVTMAGLEAGDVASDGQIWHDVDCIRVFARMTPQGKAEVIRSMQKHRGLNVLMCGDGGNDVGALKQANVGLALLSGYGDANTGDDDAVDTREDSSGTAVATQAGVTSSAEDQLNARAEKLKKKTVQNAARMKQEIKAMRTEVMSKQQQYVAAEKARLIAAGGQDGFMLTAKATVNVTKRLTAEVRTETLKIQRKYNVYRAGKDKGDGKGGVPSSIEDAMADAGLPIVKPGDASVAAPFTSRIPSVRSVVDLIRQGRCTMLSALQQQQIMMLECMIAAYTFSALTLEGARSSERQMMASGWLIMIASLAFSYATPIDKMHHVRPLHSLFHPSIFISIVGQVLIHLGCMVYGVRMATEYMGPELMKEVMRFHARQANADLLAEQALEAADPAGEDADPWADILSMWSKPFMPNLMNTVVFLVETSQLVAVLFVNYKGRPWMKGMTENHGLFLSVFICLLGVGLCAWGVFPAINAMIHLHPFPDDEFRWTVMGLCALSIGGTLLWDRLITAIFAPKIFGAMMESARATTWLDFWPAVKTMLMIVVGVGIFASGNVLLWGGAAYLYYRRRKANAEAALE
eukprot:INCI5672.1.p1 GENE.INCI5672.1~~INCI5672.1.p1  ORF type:complete len:1383 (-),score=266.40 INCI5672.1:151-4299(-)